MKRIPIYLVLLLTTVSCKDNNQYRTSPKEYKLPNDELREKVLPKYTDKNSKSKFENLLIALDSKKISYCEFMRREYEIDDSCYALALSVYPSPSDNKKFLQLHNDLYDVKQRKYLKHIEITEKEANFLETIYAFDENVKHFCGKY